MPNGTRATLKLSGAQTAPGLEVVKKKPARPSHAVGQPYKNARRSKNDDKQLEPGLKLWLDNVIIPALLREWRKWGSGCNGD